MSVSGAPSGAYRYRKRLIFFFSALALVGLGLLGRYWYIMVANPEVPADRRQTAWTERGQILDRKGEYLAMQTRLTDVSVWRPHITNLDLLCREIGPILEITPAELEERIKSSASHFVYLKKGVDESVTQALEKDIAGHKISGVRLDSVKGRIYPYRGLAAKIVGFTYADGRGGAAGIEYAFDRELTPVQGEKTGSSVRLTIDVRIQAILEEVAAKALKDFGAQAVLLSAMDPRSAEILGSASLPCYDPNDIRLATEEELWDRFSTWAYEPGSVFKVFSMAALLESGAIGSGTVFNCNGFYERTMHSGEQIRISCLGAHGPVRAREIIIYSCNAGAAYASDRMNAGDFYGWMRDFGFGQKTGAGVPGESAGFLRPAERWSERSKPTIAMGQEISVTALQMLQAAGVIANGGTLIQPRVVQSIIRPDGTETPWSLPSSRRIISEETAAALRSYMVDVTGETGTGWRAAVKDLPLAVKTGTAQIIDPATNRYSDTDYIASCVALLPAENPSLVLYLAILRPEGEILGGRIAAPTIREAAEALADYLPIPRGRNPIVDHGAEVVIPEEVPLVIGDRLPDFTGVAKRQLLPLTSRGDLNIEIIGSGYVRRQDPPPGSFVEPGMTIRLELE